MQITFAEAEFASKKKQTRRDRLLADLDSLVPWAVLEAVIEPHYPKTDGKQGRPWGFPGCCACTSCNR